MQPFEEVLSSVLREAAIPSRPLGPGECQSARGLRCRLCHAIDLHYPEEIKAKNDALQRYWRSLRVSCRLDPLVPSPLGRNYRTTTKRKVFASRDSVRLGLISPDEEGALKPFNVVQCVIEPPAHAAVYASVQERIAKPYARRFAKALQYVVIKGNYDEQTIIFNVGEMSPDVVRAANTLSKSLTKQIPSIVGVFLYEDSSSPQYYLGSRSPHQQPAFKKLFGKPDIFHRTMGRSFLFSPLSFSQVNQSILEKMIRAAEQLLQPSPQLTLFDLYCGYGLFALCLSPSAGSVVAAEVSSPSITSAIANARRQKTTNIRFLRTDINGETIERVMAHATPDDVVLLDPPRKGTSEGVIEQIAAKQPARAVHVFCEIDLIAKELKRWKGYKPVRAIPFDMFPGTATIETMILLERA